MRLRSRLQMKVDVIALKKKYEQPIFGEIAGERLLELQAQMACTPNRRAQLVRRSSFSFNA